MKGRGKASLICKIFVTCNAFQSFISNRVTLQILLAIIFALFIFSGKRMMQADHGADVCEG